MAAQLGLDHSFDMISQKGRLYLKSHQAVYGVGLSVMLVDGALFKSDTMVRRKAGRVLIPLDAATFIARSFIPDVTFEREKGRLVVRRESGKRRRTKESRTARTKDRISFIVIDAGHGGETGAVGKGRSPGKGHHAQGSRLVEKNQEKAPVLRIVVTGAMTGLSSFRKDRNSQPPACKKQNGIS